MQNALNELLPPDFRRAAEILIAILGEENPNETGMFKHFYWTLPLAKYVEIYGLDDFETSMSTIEEITKRGTGSMRCAPLSKNTRKTRSKL